MAYDIHITNLLTFSELGEINRAGKCLTPALLERDMRDTGRQQSHLRKRIGTLKRQSEIFADTREITPHVPAFGRIDVEGRCVETLCLEDWTQEERPPAHRDARLLRNVPDAHRRRVGVGRGKLEIEIERVGHGLGSYPTSKNPRRHHRTDWSYFQTPLRARLLSL